MMSKRATPMADSWSMEPRPVARHTPSRRRRSSGHLGAVAAWASVTLVATQIMLTLSVDTTASGASRRPEHSVMSGSGSDTPHQLAPIVNAAAWHDPDGDLVPVDVRPESQAVDGYPEYIGSSAGTGVEITNAIAWHDAGIDGTGIRIGVIDFFDVTDNWNVDEHGPTPIAGVTARCFDVGADCTDELFDGIDEGGEAHGVAVVETILDMAPGAEIFIGQATTVADYRALLDWFASKQVDIINRSLGARYDGPGDGRGALNEIAADARTICPVVEDLVRISVAETCDLVEGVIKSGGDINAIDPILNRQVGTCRV